MSKPDLSKLLAQARLPERTVELCTRGDLQAQFEDLERQLAEAERNPGTKLTDVGPRVIAEQIEDLRTEMREATIPLTLRALPRKVWAALLAKHPAPKDSNLAFDIDTLGPELMRVSIVDPEMDEEQWAQLDAVLTDAQFEEITDTAFALNRRAVDVPFSHAASRTLRTSEPK